MLIPADRMVDSYLFGNSRTPVAWKRTLMPYPIHNSIQIIITYSMSRFFDFSGADHRHRDLRLVNRELYSVNTARTLLASWHGALSSRINGVASNNSGHLQGKAGRRMSLKKYL